MMRDTFRPDAALRRVVPLPTKPRPSPAILHSELNKDRNRREEKPS